MINRIHIIPKYRELPHPCRRWHTSHSMSAMSWWTPLGLQNTAFCSITLRVTVDGMTYGLYFLCRDAFLPLSYLPSWWSRRPHLRLANLAVLHSFFRSTLKPRKAKDGKQRPRAISYSVRHTVSVYDTDLHTVFCVPTTTSASYLIPSPPVPVFSTDERHSIARPPPSSEFLFHQLHGGKASR